VREKGSDIKIGQTLLEKGSYLNSGAIGLLASAGVLEVTIIKRPSIGLLSTGTELVPFASKSINKG